MNILLEGVDCSGKSTFANLLSEKTGFEIVKGSSFEIANLGRDSMFSYMMELLDKNNLIIDRFMYSNLVYGSLFNYPMMSQNQYDALVDRLDRNSLVVYLHAPAGIIKYRLNNRGDNMISINDIDSILSTYKDIMFGDFRPKMMMSLDTSDSNPKLATSMIADIIDLEITSIYTNN